QADLRGGLAGAGSLNNEGGKRSETERHEVKGSYGSHIESWFLVVCTRSAGLQGCSPARCRRYPGASGLRCAQEDARRGGTAQTEGYKQLGNSGRGSGCEGAQRSQMRERR